MQNLTETLNSEDFIKPSKLDVRVILGWCHVNDRIEVNLEGVDQYDLLTETCIDSLNDSFKSSLEPEKYENEDFDAAYELSHVIDVARGESFDRLTGINSSTFDFMEIKS